MKARSDTLIMQIWNKFLESLVKVITKQTDGQTEADKIEG